MSRPPDDTTLTPARRALLRKLRGGSGSPASAPIVRRAVAGPPPLSFAQERLWFLWQLQPDSPFYNVAQAARFRGPLETDVLARAFGEIVRRHEALRTTFDLRQGSPVQRVGEVPDVAPEIVDLGGHPDPEGEAVSRVSELARRPFDLTRGPLFRLALLRLGERDHVVALVLHHIVCDGWSGALLVRELSALYGAFSRGEPSPLPELPIQYADYAVWQRSWLTGEVLDRQLAYWRSHLAGELPTLQLPADRPRPRVPSYRGAHVAFGLPPGCRDALERIGRERGATLFMTLLAAFHVLLLRTTGQAEHVVGSFHANRNRVEIEDLVGPFANTLALRNDVSGDPTFLELLDRVRETTLSAYAHQDLPFERLVEELKPPRDPSRHPLFQVMFLLQNVPPVDLGFEDTRTELVGLETGTSRFDLTLCMTDDGGELGGWCEYASDLFDAATIERLLAHWRTLLAGIARDPGARASVLPLLSQAEERRILDDWSGTAATLPEVSAVHQRFVERAAEAPDAVAVVDRGVEVSYGELCERAGRLAARLRALGVGPDVAVALSVERSTDMVVAVLGTLLAGGACLPLDPAWPEPRRRFMLDDAGARVMVQGSEIAVWGQPPTPKGSFEEGRCPPGSCPPGDLDHLAYVIYTSGSTGRPKGVAVPHRCLVNLVAWHDAAPRRSARTLQYASLSFDVSFQEIFSTLGSGGTLVLVPEEARTDAAALARLVEASAVSRAHLPNVVLQRLADELEGGAETLSCLREVMVGGEQLRVTPSLATLFRRLPGCRLHNHYGPSETHVITSHVLGPEPGDWPLLPPLGRPIPNVRLYVLDRAMQPVPAGVPGELHVGGDCLARGYLGRPDATAERFLPDPFGRRPGGRLYATGDLVRWTPDGTLEFVGRADAQVKIRGVRVEPGEVEVALGRHPGVHEAAVVVRDDPRGERQLVAFYVPAGAALEPAAVRAFLRESLPEALVPTICVPLPAFPRTPSGKLDRKALVSADVAWAPADPAASPTTELQRGVAGIWAEVLGTEPRSVHEDFFAAGGHSLLATALLSRIRQRLGADVPLSRLFDAPTVAGLAAWIEERGTTPGVATSGPMICRAPRAGRLDALLEEIEALPDDAPTLPTGSGQGGST